MAHTRTHHRRANDRVIAWLLEETNRRQPLAHMVEGLAQQLVDLGVPLWRLTSSQQAFQAEVSVLNAQWERGKSTLVREISYAMTEGDAYTNSPLWASRQQGTPIRVRLDGPVEQLTYPICRELAKAGATDYYVFTLPQEFGSFMSFATDAEGGFSDEHLTLFSDIEPAVGLRLELYVARWGRDSLLHLYLGRNAAEQVMTGSFRLGKSEDIAAVIWLCDLRGFTTLTESTPMNQVLKTLNEYFACVVGPIRDAGGEVLKFIGDAVLAIFPVADGNENDVCGKSISAARRAFANLKVVNERRRAAGGRELDFGLVLHHGVVSYGNIGAPERLDFTVRHPLKGVHHPPEIFTLQI